MNNPSQTQSRQSGGLDLAALRAKLGGKSGPRYWRSLDELAETEEFVEFLHREFPDRASEWTDPASRRTFLKLMGASLALAGVGVAGCDHPGNDPTGKAMPYVRQPANLVQGKALYFATAVSLGGVGTGVVAESHEGRPTMLEGNPAHPDSLGAIDALTQSAILGLYDPDRSQVTTKGGRAATYDNFVLGTLAALDGARAAKRGSRVRVLTGTVTSPSLARLIRALLESLPGSKWHQFEAAAPHAEKAGLKLAFGRDLSARFDLAKADVIVALDADVLANGHGRLADASAFGRRREPDPELNPPGMNRLYAVEPTMSVTGASADHRLPLKASEILPFAAALAKRLGVNVPAPAAGGGAESNDAFLDAVAKDLQAHKGAGLVAAGATQPPYVHALAALMNQALGNAGKTVVYAEPVEAEPVDQLASLADLCKAMADGQVDTLLVLGGNPAYAAPADLGFGAALKNVGLKIHLGLYEDETAALCDWHVAEAHELEAWGDVRGRDGTATIQQPLIAPLYNGKSAVELLAALLRSPSNAPYDVVRDTWREKAPKGADFETFWKASVHSGAVEGTASAAVAVEPKADLGAPPAPPSAAEPGAGAGEIELVFRPDPNVWDGRYANNGWLQELPKPVTKLTWDNAVLLSLATAERLGVTNEDVVEVARGDRKVEGPVFIMPGHANGSATVHFGYGREKTGRVGTGAGFNAFALWTSDAPGFAPGASVRKTGKTYRLATTQAHRNVDDPVVGEQATERGIIRATKLDDFLKNPGFAHHGEHGHEPSAETTLFRDDYTPTNPIDPDYQWGMVVDLNRCTGCMSCTLACQAENNIAVVGKGQVLNSREMHWIEVDRYYEGAAENPQVTHQPRMCMHCEKAPCEVVCPVAATVHDHEGLNVMIYNRCVGTRYCSNNCPYKVRHFNFLRYSDWTPQMALLNNPDVTVRARGVMEKCTYCIQRISEARYAAEIGGRKIADGEIKTACESACPTRAITFGDKSDPTTAVAKLKAQGRNYGMLAELNTRPRTTYLAKVRNPNPEIETEARHGA